MKPTYTISEIRSLVPLLGNEELEALRKTVWEEKERYSVAQLEFIYKWMLAQMKVLLQQQMPQPSSKPDKFF